MRLSEPSHGQGAAICEIWRVISSVKSLKDLWAFQEKVETNRKPVRTFAQLFKQLSERLGPGQAGRNEARVGMTLRREPVGILGSCPWGRRRALGSGQRKGPGTWTAARATSARTLREQSPRSTSKDWEWRRKCREFLERQSA